ncbi:GNAT family N-acetyltransferase [Mucilaginibacter sp. KACC 22773]|uniref:GNAT family N-acetyltransferase n=1 Tax=Mucilaginibacter sp. KACC 22773 TaxID=3025671 RepID=UPI00236663E1|nr:GNAT family N-acetyltransferase [Mucilaginibacter sp. KACC 22773]WDF80551.1 GNAT family N-acetyltransferase [Mucilaginibacter sp. KACC 22773]
MTTQDILSAITYQAASTTEHFEQIVALQNQNLYKSLTPEEQDQQGFVFAEHTVELLQQMASQIPQVIALYKNKVIGYNLAMTAAMEKQLPSLEPMFREFYKIRYQGKILTAYKFFVGGQVCVDKDFRGLGLLSKLYNATANLAGDDYELCITEIAVRNVNSLKVHQKMGFEIAGTHRDEFGDWYVVVWDIRKI